jgi:hypothetical protein
MPCVGFEPTIPASERAKIVHVYALDRAATVTGIVTPLVLHNYLSIWYDIFMWGLNTNRLIIIPVPQPRRKDGDNQESSCSYETQRLLPRSQKPGLLSSQNWSLRPMSLRLISNNFTIVTCILIARQRVGKHIPATLVHATIGHPLLGKEAVNTVFSVGSVSRSYKGTEKTWRNSKRQGVRTVAVKWSSREGIELGPVLEMQSKVTEKKWQERN